MIPDVPTRHTLREQIAQNIKSMFEEAPSGDMTINWNRVVRKPITTRDVQDNDYVLGIYDTSTKVKEGASYEIHNLNVVLEFHVRLAEGDEPSTYLNHALGEIAARIGRDISLGGLALNSREVGSELDIDGAFDKYVSGVIVFDVSYRCRPNDPYSRV